MAVGQAGRLLQLVNRLRQLAPSAARVTSSATRATGGAARVTGGATKVADAATKTAPLIPRNPLVGYGNVAKGLGKMATSPVGAYIGTGGLLLGGGTLGTAMVTPAIKGAIQGEDSPTTLTNRASEAIRPGGAYNQDTDRLTGFGMLDQLRAATGLGPRKADLEATARTKLDTKFKESGIALDIARGGGAYKMPTGLLDRKDGETQAEFEARLKPELERLNAFRTAAGRSDMGGLTGSETLEDLTRLTGDADRAKPTSAESILERELKRQSQLDGERLAQQAYQNKLADYQFTLSQARMDHQEKQAAADRQQTLQFKLMDRQDARADRAEREAVRDRQDRRAAIASMTKGLAQLGYAFAM